MVRFGRKVTLQIFLGVAICGWFFLTLSYHPWMLYVGRILAGIGYGGTGPVAVVYIGEIAKTSIRGKLLSFVEMSFQLGLLVTYLLGYFFPMRTQNIISMAIMAIYAIALMFIPESPRFYVSFSRVLQ